MALRQSLSLVQIKGLPGGLNTRDKDTEIGDLEVVNCQNVVLDDKEIRKRTGVSEFRPTEAGTDVVRGLYEHKDGATRHLLRTAATAMKYDNGSAWTAITLPITLTTNLAMNFFTYGGKTYCGNGTDNVMAWSGSAMTEKSAIPKFRFAVIWQNRAYLMGFTAAADTSTIKGSELDDVETYPAANVLRVDPRNGQDITGCAVLTSGIVVFKERSIYYYAGGYDASTSLRPIVDGVGCVAHRTITQDGKGGIYFLANDGVYYLLGTQLVRISEKIQPTIAALNGNQISKACATFYDGKYRLSVPGSGETENTLELVLDTRFSAWTKNTGLMLASVYAQAKISGVLNLFLGATATTKVYKAFDTEADNTAAIDGFLETKVYALDNPERKRKLKKLFVLAEKSGNWSAQIGYKMDDDVTYSEENISLLSDTAITYNSALLYNSGHTYGTGAGTKSFYIPVSKPKWRTIQLRVRNANASQPFVIKHLSAVFRQLRNFK